MAYPTRFAQLFGVGRQKLRAKKYPGKPGYVIQASERIA